MSKYRRAANVDANQQDIVDALRKIPGCMVEPGHDDILVGYRGRTYWFEIKNPDRALNKDGAIKPGELKDDQIRLLANWPGHYEIVWSLEQIQKRILGEEPAEHDHEKCKSYWTACGKCIEEYELWKKKYAKQIQAIT